MWSRGSFLPTKEAGGEKATNSSVPSESSCDYQLSSKSCPSICAKSGWQKSPLQGESQLIGGDDRYPAEVQPNLLTVVESGELAPVAIPRMSAALHWSRLPVRCFLAALATEPNRERQQLPSPRVLRLAQHTGMRPRLIHSQRLPLRVSACRHQEESSRTCPKCDLSH